MLLSFNFDVVNFCINPNTGLRISLVCLFSVGVVCRSVSLNVCLRLKVCVRTTSVVSCWKSQSHTSNAPHLLMLVSTSPLALAFIKQLLYPFSFYETALIQDAYSTYICTANLKRKREREREASILKNFSS